VDVDDEGRINLIAIKPKETHLRYGWSIALWTPVFTHFMHEYLGAIQKATREGNVREQRELIVGDVFKAAIESDLRVEGVVFPDDTCLDIGTPEDLVKAVRNFS